MLLHCRFSFNYCNSVAYLDRAIAQNWVVTHWLGKSGENKPPIAHTKKTQK